MVDGSDPGGAFAYPRSAITLDLAGVAAVALALVGVHVLAPEAVHDRLAFDHGAFAPETLLTSAYVHAGDAHLLNNLGGFVSLSVVTYLACLTAGRRAWFRRTFPVLLVALPVAVNLTSYVALEARYPGSTPISRGFSGVVAGFGGFLLVALGVQLRANYSRATAFFVGQFTVVLLVAELLWIYADRVSPFEGGAVAVGLASAVSGILSRGHGRRFGDDHFRQVGLDLVYVGLVVALLVWLVYGLFPARPTADGSFTNVFAHAAGLVEGGLLAALALVAVRR